MLATSRAEDDVLAIWSDLVTSVSDVQEAILDRVVAETAVAPSWFPVVVLLLGAPTTRLPMSTLSAQLSMTSGGFTKLADRIENAGLIVRVPSSEDRRVVFAALTDHGIVVGRRAAEIADQQVRERVLTRFTGPELSDLRRRIATVSTDVDTS